MLGGLLWTRSGHAFRREAPRLENDLLFLEALHYFSVHNITWRALPAKVSGWNTVWKRFSRLSKAGVFDDYFALLAKI